ncbi:glycosyltransferase [Drancourtella massiliensis]|uniref:Glycosyltransferase n=1 Tax=Drancourtella massiliensis TaxID=1632013 RepID=A0ABS2EJ99_9FIRM|nr:glycosyltransferase [Drancourtella massiliensis]
MFSENDVQVLVVTTQKNDGLELYRRMNLQTDAVISNQGNEVSYKENILNGKKIQFVSNSHKGVGKNRNMALAYADRQICILADDDMHYQDSYAKKIVKYFNKIPKADIIIFNIETIGHETRARKMIRKTHRVYKWNCLKYGAARIAVRLDRLKYANVHFSTLFGGGAKYSAGEDSLFLIECLNKGLKIYAVPILIADIKQEESSWFNGYDKKYFYDKGVLYKQISKYGCYAFCVLDIIRHRKLYKSNLSMIQIYKTMLEGMKARI